MQGVYFEVEGSLVKMTKAKAIAFAAEAIRRGAFPDLRGYASPSGYIPVYSGVIDWDEDEWAKFIDELRRR